ncbi:MAG: DUF3604 domain-containing protein [Planctomycetota bacterium]|jgi:hypothetical protein
MITLRIRTVENAWHPDIAWARGEGLAAWRTFEVDAPVDAPEAICAARLSTDGPGRAVRIAEGHFHGRPRVLHRRGRWQVLAVTRRGGRWLLIRHDLDVGLKTSETITLSSPERSVSSFDVAKCGQRQFVAFAEAGRRGRRVRVRPASKGRPRTLSTGPVWTPALARAPRGGLVAAWEEDGRIRLALLNAKLAKVAQQTVALNGRRLGSPSLAVAGQAVHLVCCSNGTWSQKTERLNEDTRLHAFRWTPGEVPEMLGGQPNGEIPISTTSRFRVYRTESAEDRKLPLSPLVTTDGPGHISVFFRHYRDAQPNDWGWTLRVTHSSDAGFGPPQDVSTEAGYPDGQYAVAKAGDGFLVAVAEAPYPVVDRAFANRHGTQPARVVFYRFHNEAPKANVPWTAMPARPGKAKRRREKGQPATWRDHALVWADLHRHSSQSRCAPEYDGTFLDHMRWAHDHEGLGCVAMADHWFGHSSDGEHRAGLSCTEANREPGRFVPLFGCEARWPSTGHVNIYSPHYETIAAIRKACGRGRTSIAEALRHIYQAGLQEHAMIVRHFHGMLFAAGPTQVFKNLLTGDETIEPVVEVVQTRGDSLEAYCRMLRAGQRKGAIGGSDHCRGPDRKTPCCLTGLWVRRLTADGIWEALRSRRCFATNGERIEVRLAAGAAIMGDAAETTAASVIRWRVRSQHPLERVDLYRNGTCRDRFDGQGRRSMSGRWRDETGTRDRAASYFIAAHTAGGGLAISSPIWLTLRRRHGRSDA